MSVVIDGSCIIFDEPRLPIRTIHPQEMFVSRKPIEFQAIFGSCVGVCLWDSESKIAGMNHFLLPVSGSERSSRYGNVSMQWLIEEMLRLGAKKGRMEAKIFGGAAINFNDYFDIGEQNVFVACDILADHGIRVVASDTGGNQGRKVIFNSNDGSVYVWYTH